MLSFRYHYLSFSGPGEIVDKASLFVLRFSWRKRSVDASADRSVRQTLIGVCVLPSFLLILLILQATVADKYGRRLVLFVSLLGTSFTCCAFGTSVTLREAIAIRLLQGIFGGAVGVARGCVTVVTDPSNEGRAYAILGFCWGFGGVAGAIIGGTCRHFSRPFIVMI